MNNTDSHASSALVQGVSSRLPVQESVDDWIANAHGNHASSVNEPDSNLKDRQIEVLA